MSAPLPQAALTLSRSSSDEVAASLTSPRSYPPETQLNWLARYIPLQDHLHGPALTSLIEVGCGPRGLSCVLSTPFVGVDMSFAAAPASNMLPFLYSGQRLPFRAGAFHTAVSMDTLEHVPPAQRRGFLLELTRVASAQVVVGFPCGPQNGERFLQGLFRRLSMEDPPWLHEHEELGLPDQEEIEAIWSELEGWSWKALPTTGNLINLMAVLMDVLPNTQGWVQPLLASHRSELESWFRSGMFGPADRKVYLLERRHPEPPRVDLRIGRSLIDALVCPDCAQGVAFGPAQELTCAGCGRVFARDRYGTPQFQAVITPAAFVLQADWLNSRDWIAPVYNYLHAFAANDSCALWLQVDRKQLQPEQVLDLLQPILSGFGDRPFPELVLNDNPEEKPNQPKVVVLPADAAELSRCDQAWFRAHREAKDSQR